MSRWPTCGGGRLLAALALGALCALAQAGEAEIRRALAAKLRVGTIESVRPAPLAGLYEVVVRGESGIEILYADGDAKLIVLGELIDARSDRNLTRDRVRELSAVKWESLPLDWAFIVRHGEGRRRVAVFSDPNCPFCRRFEGDLAKLGDVTIHLFLYPVVRPESVRQAKAVWCSRDRARAWTELLFKGVEPTASPACETPVDRIVALGRRLGAKATPAWILPNGEMHSGALPLEQVRALLDNANPSARGANRRD